MINQYLKTYQYLDDWYLERNQYMNRLQYLNKYQHEVKHDMGAIMETSLPTLNKNEKNTTADVKDPRVLRDPRTLRPQGP